jgi:HD-GYP domain-containing protein (c-di-GMP phosphodiesterase class II)
MASAEMVSQLRRSSLRIKELEDSLLLQRTSLICAFNQLVDLKDLNTGVHSTRLAEWGLRVGQELGLNDHELNGLEVAALLHEHPEYGWAVLRMLPGFDEAALAILHHHESFDGKGYPAGLKAAEAPIASRIVSVIDAFDAMVSSRPYRKGLPIEEAIRRLILASGTQFDPSVVKSFLPLAEAEMASVFEAAGTEVCAAL